tara:strand:+ start:631 stop:1083 length:453 start_codon:yes stop_codon:yes gene_type:complete
MAIVEITISNRDFIKVGSNPNTTEDDLFITWNARGDNASVVENLPYGTDNQIHYLIWNSLPGQNEIQRSNAAHEMIGNTKLTSTSDTVYGSVTVKDLLDWGEVRKNQIVAAEAAFEKAKADDETNDTTLAEGKTWADYDPNYGSNPKPSM